MSPFPPFRHRSTFVAAATALLVILTAAPSLDGRAARAQNPDDKPRLRLRASPRVAFAPADMLFVGELRGGPDDYEEFYCPTIEWEWGDDTISESTPDCEPYEPGVSEIRRRFTVRHTFDYAGRYEVRLNLKRRNDILISARTRIEIRGSRFR